MSSRNLRTIVRGAYDIQKLRIQMGNRIVGNFKAKLGQEPGEKEETVDAEGKAILTDLRSRFRKLTDGVATFPRAASFTGDEVISTYTELCLIAQYLDLEKHEDQHFRRLGTILNGYPIYAEFLKGVKGVGPAMAGVIISEIDIHKAKYPSSLWAYAGLDVVSSWHLIDVSVERGTAPPDIMERLPETRPLAPDNRPDGCELVDLSEGDVRMSEDGRQLWVRFRNVTYCVTGEYELRCLGGRSRRKEHLVEREYTDRDGKPAKRLGITFNPFLKTKLVGVLGASFLRCKDSPYATIYYDYKTRMENHSKWGTQNDGATDDAGRKVTSKGRRHNMAIRYMIKMFLIDLYTHWRELEGLPVSPPYSEAKLGIVHGAVA